MHQSYHACCVTLCYRVRESATAGCSRHAYVDLYLGGVCRWGVGDSCTAELAGSLGDGAGPARRRGRGVVSPQHPVARPERAAGGHGGGRVCAMGRAPVRGAVQPGHRARSLPGGGLRRGRLSRHALQLYGAALRTGLRVTRFMGSERMRATRLKGEGCGVVLLRRQRVRRSQQFRRVCLCKRFCNSLSCE